MTQRGCFRDCLLGLLLPRDRHKTLTGLAGAEPLVQARAGPVQGAARAAGIPFEAVGADSLYGENPTFETTLGEARGPYMLNVPAGRGSWGPAEAAPTPEAAARDLRWTSAAASGDWTAVVRSFRDGHTETWWAADLHLAGSGPDRSTRLVVATTDPAALPAAHTWYLLTNRPHPDTPSSALTTLVAASLADVVRLYGLRHWVEQSYKQVKQELGWADFQVRSDRAIRRHWYLVCCAFSFCWWAYVRHEALARIDTVLQVAPTAQPPESAGGKPGRRSLRAAAPALLAGDPAPGAQLAGPVDHALALVARLVHGITAPADPRAA